MEIPGPKIWDTKDVPEEVRNNPSGETARHFWEGVASGSNMISGSALDKLLEGYNLNKPDAKP